MPTPTARLKQNTSLLSTISNASLVLLKLVVGISIQSISVIAEAAHSGLDLAASAICLVSVRRATKPADEGHPFGHGKYESIGGAVEALLILVTSGWIIYEAIKTMLAGGKMPSQPLAGVAVLAVSVVVNLLVSARVMRVAQETDSPALAGNAWHIRSDVWTSGAVLTGLVFIWLGQHFDLHLLKAHLDPFLAIAVALMIVRVGWDLTRRNLGHLVDQSLPAEEREQIQALLAEHYPQFVSYHSLRLRKAGSERHIDLHLVMPSHLSVAEAHELCDHLEDDLRKVLPSVQVLIHVEPAEAPPPAPTPG
jgi:cation diffusion facilitator family transporter